MNTIIAIFSVFALLSAPSAFAAPTNNDLLKKKTEYAKTPKFRELLTRLRRCWDKHDADCLVASMGKTLYLNQVASVLDDQSPEERAKMIVVCPSIAASKKAHNVPFDVAVTLRCFWKKGRDGLSPFEEEVYDYFNQCLNIDVLTHPEKIRLGDEGSNAFMVNDSCTFVKLPDGGFKFVALTSWSAD